MRERGPSHHPHPHYTMGSARSHARQIAASWKRTQRRQLDQIGTYLPDTRRGAEVPTWCLLASSTTHVALLRGEPLWCQTVCPGEPSSALHDSLITHLQPMVRRSPGRAPRTPYPRADSGRRVRRRGGAPPYCSWSGTRRSDASRRLACSPVAGAPVVSCCPRYLAALMRATSLPSCTGSRHDLHRHV